jgi:hypothetical protein
VLPKFILEKYIFSVLVGRDVTFNDFKEGCCFEIFVKLDDFYYNKKLYTKLRFTNVKRGNITLKSKICEDYDKEILRYIGANHRLGNCICSIEDCPNGNQCSMWGLCFCRLHRCYFDRKNYLDYKHFV